MSLVYTTKAQSSINGGKRNSLYIGGRSDAKSFEKLERYGISHILNVTPSKEAAIQAGVPNFFEKRDRFRYKRVAVYDAPTSAPQLFEAAESVVRFISNGLHHGSVLVHCQHGVSRSTTCALFYLIRKADMSLKDSLELIQRRRPQAQPIPAFMQVLEDYEKEYGTTDHIDHGKRPAQSQVIVNNQKRPLVGSYIGPVGPPEKKKKIVLKEASSIVGPSVPPRKTRYGIGSSFRANRVTKQIGPTLPPEKSKESIEESRGLKNDRSIGPSTRPNKNDRPTGSSPSLTMQSGSVGPSLPTETKEKQIGPSLPTIESYKL